ncbi:eCIS core domain-containing protein [Dyella choica]|uniref:eCIS core domain-containing protein n=1 Tax=Dyella choica TaxID=1927959 RepID=UPI00131575FD|nr:DUF4157 domain-containing protein [Dyella choica]
MKEHVLSRQSAHETLRQQQRTPATSSGGLSLQRKNGAAFGGSPRLMVQRQARDRLQAGSRQAIQRQRLDTLQRASAGPSAKKTGGTGGLPDRLRMNMEAMSGIALDDVRVHRNSGQPAQLNALAYAQGNDIHLGPGQEQHLPHEAWHVVQQRQGRVAATAQLAGYAINDNVGLEREADAMGAHAQRGIDVAQPMRSGEADEHARSMPSIASVTAQRMEVAQLLRLEHKGIGGLTHLVEMTEEGSIYDDVDWRRNEREEVSSGDLLMVDLDDAWYSRRGMHQEDNWEQDRTGEQKHLWLSVLELNHQQLDGERYVREEMLVDGWEDIPKSMHSIWIQGDYESNPEAVQGLETRQGADMYGWVNMVWLYNSGMEEGGFSSELQTKKMEVHTETFAPVLKRGFVQEMQKWQDSGLMPEWVEGWLPILKILLAKKSYIAMSDIMRMIILYYEGGVYMDVKIQVQSGKAKFKDRPMLLINTANFYAKENWAIMANAGCQMIEAIMTQALQQFPSVEELEGYPENYQQEPGKEGRMHVNLHERLGVWNIVERYRHHDYGLDFPLRNPRPVNSWSHSYEDRPWNVVWAEAESVREGELSDVQSKLAGLRTELRVLEEAMLIPVHLRPTLSKMTEEQFAEIPQTIETLNGKIELLTLEVEQLSRPTPLEEQDDDDDDDDDAFAKLMESMPKI